MSRTLSAPVWGKGALAAGTIALLALALMALGPAPRANAAFTTSKCAGPDIIGEGASFAREAHKVFNSSFKNFFCVGTPGFGAINVQYEAEGSGAGRRSVKFRDRDPRFGMTDDPPTPAEIEQMNAGTGEEPAEADINPNDNGIIHVVPAAVGAVVPLVNFPDGCPVAELDAESRTDNDADLMRVRFTKAEYEEVWAQGFESGAVPYLNWSDVFTELEDADCDVPITRVVRFDDSGTTFAFKDYLRSIVPGRGWHTTFAAGPNETQEWPGAEFGERTDCGGDEGPGNEPDEDDHLTSGCSNGNGGLVDKLVVTDGSIGYSDLATARNDGLAVDPAGGDNDTYWTQVQNGSNTFVEPSADVNGYRTDGEKGANCQATEFEGVPGSTLEDWSGATGVNSEVGYGICTMTYGLVFDDNADVWGNTPEEEAQARTVKDYWASIVSEGAQSRLFENDYAPLPPGVLAVSKAGIASVDWNKGAGGGGGGGGGGGNDDDDGDDDSSSSSNSVAPPPLPIVPSNLFSLLRKRVSSKTGQANLAVKLPGAGRLVVVGRARVQVGGRRGKRGNRRNRRRTKSVNVGRIALNANRAGTFNLKLTPRGAARRELRKKGRLPVALRMTFLPNGGTANTSNSRVVLRMKTNKRNKKNKRSRGGKRR